MIALLLASALPAIDGSPPPVAEPFDLKSFAPCGISKLKGVAEPIADITLSPSRNTLLTVGEAGPEILEHDLAGNLLGEVPHWKLGEGGARPTSIAPPCYAQCLEL